MAAPGGAIDASLANITATATANHAAATANHAVAMAAINANHAVAMAAINANHAAATANHAAAMAAIGAAQLAIQAQLAAIVNPAQIAGNLLAISSARAANAHCLRGLAYAAVPLPNGALPPNWIPGFERSDLLYGPIGAVDDLLQDYGLPFGAVAGIPTARRQTLGNMIGTPGI